MGFDVGLGVDGAGPDSKPELRARPMCRPTGVKRANDAVSVYELGTLDWAALGAWSVLKPLQTRRLAQHFRRPRVTWLISWQRVAKKALAIMRSVAQHGCCSHSRCIMQQE